MKISSWGQILWKRTPKGGLFHNIDFGQQLFPNYRKFKMTLFKPTQFHMLNICAFLGYHKYRYGTQILSCWKVWHLSFQTPYRTSFYDYWMIFYILIKVEDFVMILKKKVIFFKQFSRSQRFEKSVFSYARCFFVFWEKRPSKTFLLFFFSFQKIVGYKKK